ncbi:MAG: hypothetical protein AB7R55_02755 [Gemmatimonadales bacterium]
MRTNRRSFLETMALGTLGAVTVGELEATPPPMQGRQWDLSWVAKLTGRYRAIFDVTSVEDGFGVWRAAIWRKQYATVFAVPERDLDTVVNVRHDAISLVLDQDYWAKYGVARKWNVHDPATRMPTSRNPVIDRTGAHALPPEFADFTLEALMKGGAIVLVCSLALRDCASLVARTDKLDMAEAEAVVRRSLVPGVILQPSGIFSAVLAQDNGCRYVRAS